MCIWFTMAAMLYATPASCAAATPLPPEVACTEIRDSVRKVAQAERDQALALHLMANGKPTAVVQTRLTELQAHIGDLRETLRRVRHNSSRRNPDVAECLQMGFKSLNDAESVTRQIQDVVMGEGGPLGLPPQIRSGESDGGKLPEPSLPPAAHPAE
jgi:hypothetical protein